MGEHVSTLFVFKSYLIEYYKLIGIGLLILKKGIAIFALKMGKSLNHSIIGWFHLSTFTFVSNYSMNFRKKIQSFYSFEIILLCHFICYRIIKRFSAFNFIEKIVPRKRIIFWILSTSSSSFSIESMVRGFEITQPCMPPHEFILI